MQKNLLGRSFSVLWTRRCALSAQQPPRTSRSFSLTVVARDHSLFEHTTGKWLYNDAEQRAVRRVNFDVEALKDIACRALGQALISCTGIQKIGEDSLNKTYLLSFDEGQQLIAKIPCPMLFANVHQVIASEVATMSYLNDMRFPYIPRVFAWSDGTEATLAVQSEFILMEYIPGVPLQNIWDNILNLEPATHCVNEVVFLQRSFSSSHFRKGPLHFGPFSQIGSLFFKEDVDRDLRERTLFVHQCHPLYKDNEDMVRISEKYRIGPLVDRDWWHGPTAASTGVDRGPWTDLQSYLLAASNLVRSRLALKPPTLPHQRVVGFLDKYDQLVPSLIPPTDSRSSDPKVVSISVTEPILSHPNLSASNILVDDSTLHSDHPEFKAYINWQGASALPLMLHTLNPPPLIQYNARTMTDCPIVTSATEPPCIEDGIQAAIDNGTISEDEKHEINRQLHLAERDYAYQVYLSHGAEGTLHSLASLWPHTTDMVDLVDSLLQLESGTVGDDLVPLWLQFNLREAISLRQVNKKYPPAGKLVHFTEEELDLQTEELLAKSGMFEEVMALQKALGPHADPDGWVSDDSMWESMVAVINEAKQRWEKKGIDRVFPFSDGAKSPSLVYVQSLRS